MLTSFKRVVKIGYKNFLRNIGLSIGTVFILSTVVFLITALFLFNWASNILIADIRDKVDVSVYFKEDAPTENIMEIKSEISKIPDIKEVNYISKEETMQKFIDKNKDNPVIMESLNELGANPFFSSLDIKAWEASQYDQVIRLLDGEKFKEVINKVDYYPRKPLIDKVFSVTSSVNRAGIAISVILALIAILAVFNTIRIAIFNSKEEISVMRLVGASNWFIRGPFLVEGAIAGLVSVIIVGLLTFGVCYGLNASIKGLTGDISTFGLFANNFLLILFIQLVAGIGLGVFSSIFAIRKHLNV